MSNLLQRLSDEEREKARETSMPDWMDPMLAKLTHDHFTGEEWIFERKLDGERLLAYIEQDGQVRLMSRNQKRINDSYPEIEEALADQVPAGCILDGEVVAFDEHNVSDFQRVLPRRHASSRQEARQSGVKVYYYMFDCLYVEGHDITRCPLRSRKKVLKAAIRWDDPLRWTPHCNDDGLNYYKEACSKGWEGLIAKHAGSEYVHGRSSKWLKFKCVVQQEFVICGFTEPHGERVGFGALLLGFYRGDDLVYAGKVGTGFDDQTLNDLRGRLEALERETSPYDRGKPQTKGVHFVTPRLVCEVRFTEWTGDDDLRHPRYKGLRRDKDPKDVHKEAESQKGDL
ncbi:MAG: non-homologous end-joining DNA ligase [Candidatus Bipolaricaulaceae bacterium]